MDECREDVWDNLMNILSIYFISRVLYAKWEYWEMSAIVFGNDSIL